MHSIYNLFIAIYGAILRVASLFSHKISTMCEGESKAFDVLSAIKPDDKVVWFHCASLGEFEQGRMLIESLKRQQPDFKILLSFYSPSGYEVRKTTLMPTGWSIFRTIRRQMQENSFLLPILC